MPLQTPPNYDLGLPDPTDEVRKNLEMAMGLQQQQQKSQLIGLQMQEQARQNQAIQMKVEEAKRNEAMMAEFAEISKNPSPDLLAKFAVKYPGQSENIKRSFDMLSEQKKKEMIHQSTNIYTSILSGRPDLALKQLDEAATAYENSNQPDDAKALRDLYKQIEQNPMHAATAAGAFLASVTSPEKFAETFRALALFNEQKRQEVAETKSKEEKAEQDKITTKYKEGREQAELRKTKGEAFRAEEAGAKDKEETSFAKDVRPLKVREQAAKTVIEEAPVPFASQKAQDEALTTRATRVKAESEAAVSKRRAESEVSILESDALIKKVRAANIPAVQKAELEQIVERTKYDRAATAKINKEIDLLGPKAALELDKLRAEIEKTRQDTRDLPLEVTKDVTKKNADTIKATKLLHLAIRLHREADTVKGFSKSGLFAWMGESVKRWTGDENEVSQFRRDVERIIVPESMKLLPPGQASDKDVEFARKPFPEVTANPEQIKSFLRGVAKLAQFDALASKASSDWQSQNRSEAVAQQGITLDGIRFPKGTSFTDALDHLATRRLDWYGKKR